MKKLPYWLQASIFALLLIPIIFFLKVLCPISTGCLADPFLLVIFSPLFIFNFVYTGQNPTSAEPIFIVMFWVVLFAVLGFLYGKIKSKPVSGDIS